MSPLRISQKQKSIIFCFEWMSLVKNIYRSNECMLDSLTTIFYFVLEHVAVSADCPTSVEDSADAFGILFTKVS